RERTREVDRARSLVEGDRPLRGVGMMEERAAVDAGDDEPRVGEARARLAEPGPPELGPGPERVVVLEEAQLDAVVAVAARGVDHAGEGPGRAAEGGEGELHVIRSSMAGGARGAVLRPGETSADAP